MTNILNGKAVADALDSKLITEVENLKKHGIQPALAILRVGARDDDISYERGIAKKSEQIGVAIKNVVLPAQVPEKLFFQELCKLNAENTIHGILMFRPLPDHIDSEKARKMLSPAKDIDGCTDSSLAGIFTNTLNGFAPCTAQAAMEILRYYGIEISGKNAVVIGRSLVVGRPVAMLLMHQNATVTICHTRTKNIVEITRNADIIIAASGQMESIGAGYFSKGQTVIDVGIGWNEEKQKLCGDVKFNEAKDIVKAITPVPGGVGSVTTTVLISHVIEAARKRI